MNGEACELTIETNQEENAVLGFVSIENDAAIAEGRAENGEAIPFRFVLESIRNDLRDTVDERFHRMTAPESMPRTQRATKMMNMIITFLLFELCCFVQNNFFALND